MVHGASGSCYRLFGTGGQFAWYAYDSLTWNVLLQQHCQFWKSELLRYSSISIGAGNPDRAQRFAALGVLVVMIFGVVNGGAGLLYRNAWGKVWSPDEPVQRMVAEMMPYMALYVLLYFPR